MRAEERAEVIRTLETALAQARAGELEGVAVITSAGPQAFSVKLAGGCPCELHAGCGKAQHLLLSAMAGELPALSRIQRPT